MKRYNGEEGSQVDEMEEANKSTAGMLSNPNAKEFGDSGTSETAAVTTKATPKAAPKPKAAKPAAKAESAPAAKAAPVDVTKLSVAERRKLSRENPSVSGPTDTRSVSQRLRAAFGMRSGGATKKMASGGMTSSASKRADGIAVKGKTRGKMC
jgi:outer membrane biosynthesis protein TonB